MGRYEKCSLVALFIAYIVVKLLIITYEVTECQLSQIKLDSNEVAKITQV